VDDPDGSEQHTVNCSVADLQLEVKASPGRSLRSSDTGRAAGLGLAAMAMNAISLVFTVVFARVLGEDGYGSLITLLSAFLILAIPGQALQVAVAREVSREAGTADSALTANVRSWAGSLAALALLLAAVGALARRPLADLLGVEVEWAAAATLPMACGWILLCLERGVLQGIGRYFAVGASLVGEALARLAFALAFVGAGLGATGAFLGTGAAVLAVAAVLALLIRQRLARAGHEVGVRRPLGGLVRESLVAVVALGLFALLQNVDVIVVRNLADERTASDYAAVSVAAKALIWVAIGLGLFLLPEAARRAKQGLDGRPVLIRTIALVGAAGAAATLIFAFFGQLVLRLAFGEDLAQGAPALPWLTVAMTALAVVYLCVQFLLALERRAFLAVLAIAGLVEPVALAVVGADLTDVALTVLGVDFVLVAGVGVAALQAGSARPSPQGPGRGLIDPDPVTTAHEPR